MSGPGSEVIPHAIALRDYVSKKTGLEIGLWSIGFGAPVGTMIYAVRVDGLAGVNALGAQLIGDTAYEALLAKGAAWVVGAAEDSLRESLNDEMNTMPPVGSVVTVTTAVIAAGMYAKAIGWGIEIAEHVLKVTGMPVSFQMEMFGTFGQVAWIGVAANSADADAMNAKINADAGYMDKLGATAGLFVDGMSHRMLGVRVA